MQKSDRAQTAKISHRQMRTSTTLNRKYVKKPLKKFSDINKKEASSNLETAIFVRANNKSPMITRFGRAMNQKSIREEMIQPAKAHPSQIIANNRLRERKQQLLQQKTPTIQRLTAKELKDQAIKKALQAASRQQSQQANTLAQQIQTKDTSTKQKTMRFGLGRIILALSCAAAAIFAIVYFVNLNMPDIQFRAAAAQLDATYPNYIPYNYNPTSISSENDIVTLNFKNRTTDESFYITEEKSSWDSNSLLNNYVKDEYGEDYTIIREQGLTVYIGSNKAAWVNGGVVYKLNIIKGSLSKKQISSIAVSF